MLEEMNKIKILSDAILGKEDSSSKLVSCPYCDQNTWDKDICNNEYCRSKDSSVFTIQYTDWKGD